MVNPLWLRTFVTLVEQKHFTHTAEQLAMTQSGVSQHVRKLENYYDTALINRNDKPFELTAAGEQVYLFAREHLLQERILKEQIQQDGEFSGICRIASPGALGLKLYHQMVELQKRHPGLFIHYEVAPNHLIQTQLLNNHIDVGLMTCKPDNSGLSATQVSREELCLVAGKDAVIECYDDITDIHHLT